jgi:hypothetical protein
VFLVRCPGHSCAPDNGPNGGEFRWRSQLRSFALSGPRCRGPLNCRFDAYFQVPFRSWPAAFHLAAVMPVDAHR